MIKRIGTVLGIGLMSVVGWGQTTSGELTENEVWSGEVTLTGDVVVGFGTVLTISPGTVVTFAGGDDTVSGVDDLRTEIILEGGQLVAEGTSDAPIAFRSSAGEPKNNDWYGIRCDLGRFVGRHLQVQHADVGLGYERGGDYQLSDSSFSHCDLGVRISAGGKYFLERLRFVNRADGPSMHTGISVNGISTVDLIDSEFERFSHGVDWGSTGALKVTGADFRECESCVGINFHNGSLRVEGSSFSRLGGKGIFVANSFDSGSITVLGSRFLRCGVGN